MKRYEKIWNDMKRYEKIWNTHYTMGESMSRQYWVHPVQVRSLELLATVEYHLYSRILFPLVRSDRSCIPEMLSIAFQRPWYCQSILAALQEGLSWKVWAWVPSFSLCSDTLINFEQSSTFFYLKTYECIWKRMNVCVNLLHSHQISYLFTKSYPEE